MYLQNSCPIGLFTSPAPGAQSHLYPMVLHVLHTGHTDQGWVPAVHGLQLHVNKKAVWGSLQGDSSLQAEAQYSSAETPKEGIQVLCLENWGLKKCGGQGPGACPSSQGLRKFLSSTLGAGEPTHHLEGPGGHSRGPSFLQVFLPTEAIRVWVVWGEEDSHV